MIKVVLFDLDDTLISEDDYIKSGYHSVSKIISKYINHNDEKIFEDLCNLYLNDSKKVFNRLLDIYDIQYTKQDILKLVDIYRNHIPDIQFYDDVLPCINYLKSKNIQLGIISDGHLSTQLNKAKVLGLYKLFDKVIFTEELGREYWKPHPKSFEIMKDAFNVEYKEMVYIGDNPQKDFYINKNCPIQTIRIYRENSIYVNNNYYKEYKENFQIYTLDDLEMVLKKVK